jgi:adenylate cyclase
LAEALGDEGQLDEGLLLLEELILTIEETDQRFWKAELHRLKGDFLGRQHLYLDEAERAFREAVKTARRQKAKSLELRALMGLVYLHQEQGREEGYNQQLSQLVEWFTEGFDTPDLKEAKALLAALG